MAITDEDRLRLLQLQEMSVPPAREESFPRRVVGAVVDTVVGKNEFDLPEISSILQPKAREGNRAALNAIDGLLLARDEPGQWDIIKRNFPEARFTRDTHGNTIVRIGQDVAYLNRSGISGEDVRGMTVEGAIQGAMTLPMARAGQAVLGTVGRVVGTGTGMAAGSMAQDQAARVAGSKQPIDVKQALLMGTFGSVIEAGALPVARVLQRVFSTPALYDPAAGRLTERGATMLREANIDPATVTPDVARRFQDLVRQTDDVGAAARQAEARSLPAPVTLSPGQATRNPTLYGTESEAKKGVFGPEAQGTMLGFQDEQQAALRANIPGIQDRLTSGGRLVDQPGQGAAVAQERLVGQRQSMNRMVGNVYRDARAAGEAWFPTEAVQNMGRAMRESIQDFDAAAYPNLVRQLDNLDSLIAPVTQGNATLRPTQVNIDALERWRARATSAANASNVPAEQTAIRNLIRTYDGQMEGALRESLLRGDEAAIDAWRNARAARRRFGEVFEQDDIVKELTARMNDGSRRLVVQPDNAVNYIFGRARLGAVNGLERDLVKLRDTLGPNSQEWQMIREEGFLRLFRGQNLNEGPFNAAAFARELDQTMKEAPRAMRLLFSDQELALFQMLKRTATNVNSPPAIVGNINPSGTSWANRLADSFGPLGRMAQAYARMALTPYRQMQGTRGAQRATTGALPPRAGAVPPGAAGLLGVPVEGLMQ